MRKLFFTIIASLLVSLFFSSCEKWIDTDINNDPDRLDKIPMKVLLPSIQVQMAYLIGGNDAVRPTNIWMQYFDGVDRQSLTTATYIMSPSDPNNFWNNMYSGTMQDISSLIKQSEAEKSLTYRGVAKVCMAVCLGELTNLFGAIPYTDALKGDLKLTPKYDKQSTIYKTIKTLLVEAKSDLDASNEIPLAGDLMYGNNVTLWKKAAESLLARTELNLSKVAGNSAYANALAHISEAFTSNNHDLQLNFVNSESNANPIYQFMVQRGDIVMCKTFTDLLKGTSDPRLPFYVTPVGNSFDGSYPGAQTAGASLPGIYNSSISSPVFFITYAEVKFIESEAKYQSGDKLGALKAYKDAVSASILKVTGSVNDAWLNANINNETTATLTLEIILKQKYLALYSQNQAYTDFRRTGLPNVLSKPTGSVGALPRRFPYPQDEMTYNKSNVPVKGDLKGTMWIDGGEDVGSL